MEIDNLTSLESEVMGYVFEMSNCHPTIDMSQEVAAEIAKKVVGVIQARIR